MCFSYVFEESIFRLFVIFQFLPKLIVKLTQGNLTPFTISFFIITFGPLGPAHGLGWAF